MNSIGERLSNLITDRGLTPYKVSKRTGVSQSTLSRIINHNTIPNESNLKALIDFFDVDESWFLTGEKLVSQTKITNTHRLQPDQIKEKRKRLGITSKELAEMIGVSTATIYNYESGGVIPESKTAILKKILDSETAVGPPPDMNTVFRQLMNGYMGDHLAAQQKQIKLQQKQIKKLRKKLKSLDYEMGILITALTNYFNEKHREDGWNKAKEKINEVQKINLDTVS